jgi:hypothetical protein
VVDKVALGQVFSEYFGFLCQSSFHQLLHTHHHLSSGAGIIGQQWPTYQVDSVTPHPEKLKRKNYVNRLARKWNTPNGRKVVMSLFQITDAIIFRFLIYQWMDD